MSFELRNFQVISCMAMALSLSACNSDDSSEEDPLNQNQINQSLKAQDLNFTLKEDEILNAKLQGSSETIQSFAFALVALPSVGEIKFDSAEGTFSFTPIQNFSGSVQFKYVVLNDLGRSPEATVSITVEEVNDGPIAVSDSVTVREDGLLEISPLENDSDIEGQGLSITEITEPANGQATILVEGEAVFSRNCASDSEPFINQMNLARELKLFFSGTPQEKIIYIPNCGFHGSDEFNYKIEDESGATSTARITVTVQPRNTCQTIGFDGVRDLLVNRLEIPLESLTSVGTTFSTLLDQEKGGLGDLSGSDIFDCDSFFFESAHRVGRETCIWLSLHASSTLFPNGLREYSTLWRIFTGREPDSSSSLLLQKLLEDLSYNSSLLTTDLTTGLCLSLFQSTETLVTAASIPMPAEVGEAP